jgi:hypothetical protein
MAVGGCIAQDMAGARIDVASAISVATSLGVEPATAAVIIMAAAAGFNEGLAERQKEAGAPEEG